MTPGEVDLLARSAIAQAVGCERVELRWSAAFEADVAALIGQSYSTTRGTGCAVARTIRTETGVIVLADATPAACAEDDAVLAEYIPATFA